MRIIAQRAVTEKEKSLGYYYDIVAKQDLIEQFCEHIERIIPAEINSAHSENGTLHSLDFVLLSIKEFDLLISILEQRNVPQSTISIIKDFLIQKL